MTDLQEMNDKIPETTVAAASQEHQETIDEILSRHRKETKQLQGSKAKQKSKKKQVEEEISWLSTDLKEKQAKELASLGYSSNKENNNQGEIDNLVRAIQGVSASSQPDQSKPSKSAKRMGKRAQKDAEREQRIKEEQSKVVSDRVLENERLEKKLEPLGLMVNEIKPDGHCLYRAVEHQLAYLSGGLTPYNFQKLREMVSVYMRTRSSDFLPFFLSENAAEGNSEDSDSVEERFENYYKEIKSTAAWGGHLELGALTHCLRKHIIVCSGSFPDVEMGKEYKYGGGLDSSILLSYHKHAFGLGEHYNSVVHDATK